MGACCFQRCYNQDDITSSSSPNQQNTHIKSQMGFPQSRMQKRLEQSNSAQKNYHKGIKNIGNTCYISSVLQCLLHSKQFVNKLKNVKNKKPQSLSKMFLEFVTYMNNTKKTDPYSPQQIKNKVSKMNCLFSNYNQHDASQFLSNFFAIISEQLNEPLQSQTLKPIDHRIRTTNEIKEKEKKEMIENIYKQTKKRDQSICKSVVEQTFTGRYQVAYTCEKCKQIYVLFQKFNLHYLQIPVEKTTLFTTNHQFQKCKLKQCLRKFTEKEKLYGQNQMTCERCQRQTNHLKIMQIYEPNQILVITIKRFYKGVKNTAKIQLPQELTIDQVVTKDNRNYYKGKVFKLYAAILHQGTLQRGHYTSYCLNQTDNNWIQYSDSYVSEPKNFQNISLENAYVVFYKLVDKPANKGSNYRK